VRPARPHHHEHAQEAEHDRAPAVTADFLLEDQRRQRDREQGRREADRGRFRQRQISKRTEGEHHRRQADRRAHHMRHRPLRPPCVEIPVPRDPQQQRREAKSEAVEGELGRADALRIAELDHRRHEGEAGRRGDAEADAEQAILLRPGCGGGRHEQPVHAALPKKGQAARA
jgi:hypothetical protein